VANTSTIRSQRSPISHEVDTEPVTSSDPVIRLEIYGILVLAFAMALLLALFSFDIDDVGGGPNARTGQIANLLGPIGAHIADMFLAGLGIGSLAVAGIFGWLGYSYLVGRRGRMEKLDVFGAVVGLISLAVLAHVIASPVRFLEHAPGGLLGAWIGEIASSLLSGPGTFLTFGALGVVSLVLLTRKSVFELAGGVWRVCAATAGLIGRTLRHGESDEEAAPSRARASVRDDDGPRIKVQPPLAPEPEVAKAVKKPRAKLAEAPTPVVTEAASEPRIAEPRGRAAVAPVVTESHEGEADDIDELDDDSEGTEAEDEAWESDDEDDLADSNEGDEDQEEADKDHDAAASEGIKIVESAAMRRTRELSPEAIEATSASQLVLPTAAAEQKPFVLPTLSMLDYKPPETTTYDRELLKRNAQILETKLLDYKVKGKVVEIHPGPVITMYEFMPAPGVKVSAIANLANDLAMALSAISIRIVAPIPGKNVVGIEIPNATRETVWLKEILSDAGYARAKSKLTLALGKDIVGNPSTMDLAKAPHLLVAGATGAGKSVAINSFVVSLLYKAEPSDVRLIMVDPKMLELSIYEGIPHLLLPVVTDPKQAATALKWAVREMERRYKLMADMGVRNLAGFNQKVVQLLEDPSQRLPERLRLAKLKREAKGEVDPKGQILDGDGKPLEKLPAIVVIIDELADLMMVASKEVEHCIARLAQMARAAGIHLILATQRPSVDVITGLIKANFPTRISFRVASQIDSRTILDHKGAEALLGMGDMLFLPPGSALQRVHGCYVSEEEVHTVVAHLKEQGSPEYDMGILASDDDEGGDDAPVSDGDGDGLYNQAVRIAIEERYISTSRLQRKLKIGYNRAARIIEQMEENGIIGPSDGTSRPREVFIDPA
jgi:S-DNA-T family DNA segregation ATPase FtsK/SpoIIIE